MPAPHGTLVDLNIIQKQIGYLIRFLGRNSMSASHTVSAQILTQFTTLNTAIQAATTNLQLSVDPTLPLRYEINPDPGVANSDGSRGPDNTTLIGTNA